MLASIQNLPFLSLSGRSHPRTWGHRGKPKTPVPQLDVESSYVKWPGTSSRQNTDGWSGEDGGQHRS